MELLGGQIQTFQDLMKFYNSRLSGKSVLLLDDFQLRLESRF